MNGFEDFMSKYGLELTSEFVPFSKSKHRKDGHRSLNWGINLKKNGRTVLETDFHAGIAYCPSFSKYINHYCCEAREVITYETEHGREYAKPRNRIHPNVQDVMHCLHRDADALEYASFEDWASDYGFDADSRAAEKTYNECMKIALALRSAIGDTGIEELRVIFADY